jgi:hypothetical protein
VAAATIVLEKALAQEEALMIAIMTAVAGTPVLSWSGTVAIDKRG